ncbi:hypothetical protein [Nostoc sp. WHI]|uniref:hypothetical protein n=1 Tax=Nostoc sp. WHI TaxID=2650611 RepID=UPI0018C4B781|nr:hypothetical protein [Nostoc sp. WHI]MBG1265468.1 hypothetical protein [Nostoc sp. WHI]MBG1265491.1 hypothetical protein [Nostoc sp. WHI]
MTVEIDPFPVAALLDRYNLGKQAVYNRIDALDIKTFKQGNKSYITASDVELLDQLHDHISAGGKMDDFKSPKTELVNSPLDRLDTSSRLVDRLDTTTGQPDLALGEVVQLVEAIARHLRPAEPLQHLKALEEAAAAGWLLSSSEVEGLIRCKPRVKSGESQFTRGSFSFVRSGKIGNQSGWKVVRVN